MNKSALVRVNITAPTSEFAQILTSILEIAQRNKLESDIIAARVDLIGLESNPEQFDAEVMALHQPANGIRIRLPR
jgi:hypothetical protein